MSKLYLVDCGNFPLHLENFQSLRGPNTLKMVGKKKFQVFYNARSDQLTSAHLKLWQAAQNVVQETYLRKRDQMTAMFGQRITAIFTISGSNPHDVKVEVKGRYLEKLMAAFGQPLKLNFSLTLGRWNSNAAGAVTKITIIGNEYVNQKGVCEFKSVADIALPHNFQHNLLVDGCIVIEVVPADNVVFRPSPDHLKVMKRFYETKPLCDFHILANNNKKVPCHRVFLSANSPVFARILVTDCKETKDCTYQLDLSEKGVDALLKYIYYRSLDDPLASCRISYELMDIAHQYEIIGLEESIKDIFLGKSYLWYDIEVAMDLYLYALKMKDDYKQLTDEIVKVIKMKREELEGSEVFQTLREEDIVTAAKLLEFCYSN